MVILIQCQDKIGLVAAIAGVMSHRNLNIVSMREHVDTEERRFFMRLVSAQHADITGLEQQLKEVLPADAIVSVNPDPEKQVILLVSKEYHCLSDILVRNHFKTLGAVVHCVIGNHAILQDVCKRFDLPFFHVSHEGKEQHVFEAEIKEIVQKHHCDYLVLAKFMRILSPAFIADFPMRIINIHHSFLPAFTGAGPYKQAYSRGVKMIGATAHFVTDDLDQGPIIGQQSIPVDHSFTVTSMIKAGREIETAVLAKALKVVFEDRVFVYNNKTVVFD